LKSRRYAVLLAKNYYLHINQMLLRNLLLAPCLALKIEFLEAPLTQTV
jgi:hypothetical protein